MTSCSYALKSWNTLYGGECITYAPAALPIENAQWIGGLVPTGIRTYDHSVCSVIVLPIMLSRLREIMVLSWEVQYFLDVRVHIFCRYGEEMKVSFEYFRIPSISATCRQFVRFALNSPGCHEQISLGSASNLCGHSRLCGVLCGERTYVFPHVRFGRTN